MKRCASTTRGGPPARAPSLPADPRNSRLVGALLIISPACSAERYSGRASGKLLVFFSSTARSYVPALISFSRTFTAPPELRGGAEVVEAGGGVGESAQQKHMMAPRDSSDQFSHSLCEFFSGLASLPFNSRTASASGETYAPRKAASSATAQVPKNRAYPGTRPVDQRPSLHHGVAPPRNLLFLDDATISQ